MSANSKIEWTDHTFNPWIGCTKVSPGCDNCYAERREDLRLHRVQWGPGQPRHRTKTWGDPVRWNKRPFYECRECGWRGDTDSGCPSCAAEVHSARQRVFCASLADVFDNEVDPAWRADLFDLIRATPSLDWLLLTKRIGNAAAMLPYSGFELPNVWLGATVVNQEEADRDIPKLLGTPARVRFLSIEPMLGPVWLGKYLKPGCTRHGASTEADGKCEVCEGRGIWSLDEPLAEHEKAPLHTGLDWIIAGGESGPNARPAHPDWFRSLRDRCAAAGVPFLFKQWGEWLGALQDGAHDHDPLVLNASDVPMRVGKKCSGRLLDGAEHNGMPEEVSA